jgi:hypothetical protein
MFDLLAFNLITLFAALLWAAALRLRPRRFFPVAALLLHILIIQAWTLATGLLGHLDLTTWRTLAAGLSLLLALFAATRRNKKIHPELATALAALSQTIRSVGPLLFALGSLAILLVVACLAVVGYLVGPYLPDVTNYHLAPPTDWLVAGRITGRNWIDSRAWWPQGHGLLDTWWMLPTRDLRLVVFANLQWLALGFAVVYALARQLGATRRLAFLALCLLVTLPIVWTQTTSGLNDLAVCVLTLAALAPLAHPRLRPGSLLLVAVALLTALGIKPTALLLAPPIVALALFRLFSSRKPDGEVRRAVAGPSFPRLALLLLALALPSYWYARNAAAWGNPLYPATVQLAGHKIFLGDPALEKDVGRPGLENFTQNLPDLLLHRIWDPRPVRRADVVQGTGFGAVATGLGLVSMAALLVLRRRVRAPFITVLAMVAVLAWGIVPDDWFGRFFAFWGVALALSAALVLRHLRPAPARATWIVMLALAAALSIAAGLRSTTPGAARNQWALQGLGPVDLSTLTMLAEGWIVDAAAPLPEDQPLVVFSMHLVGAVGAMHGPHLSRPLIYADAPIDRAQVERWKKAGATRLIAAVHIGAQEEARQYLTGLGLQPISGAIYELP